MSPEEEKANRTAPHDNGPNGNGLEETPEAADRQKLLAVNLGLAANVVLALLKTTVGVLGHSPALLADGINSTSDVVYLVVVRIFMGLAGKPPDREHPYGHQQLESIAAVVVGAFVVTTAVTVFWSAVNSAYSLLTTVEPTEFVGANLLALWVALLTIVAKVWLTVFTGRIGRATGSIAVLALARDHRNDFFSIVAATIGIFLGRTHAWLDPMAAAVVAIVILRTGIDILRDSSADLMDVLPSKPVVEHIRELLHGVPGIEQVEEIHVHRIGLYVLVDVTIGVDGTLTVAAGDEIANQVEHVLWKHVEYVRRVSVHYHPSRLRRVDSA